MESSGLFQILKNLLSQQGALNALGDAGFRTIDTGRDVVNTSGLGIRSPRARFDPATARSKDTLSSLAPAGLLDLG